MSARRELTVEQKKVVINLTKQKFSQKNVAGVLNVSQSCISKFLKRWKCRKSVENLQRSGRPKKTDDRCDRRIIRHVKCHRKQTLQEITNTVNNFIPQSLAPRTVRRRLRSCGFTRRKIRKSIVISRANRVRRVSWCRQKLGWTVKSDWQSVIFSDETQVVIGQNNKVYVWRRATEVWRPECLGGGRNRKISVMFWGCISYFGVGTLVPVDGHIDSQKYIEILDENLWPVVCKYFGGKRWFFQDDNAPVHRSLLTRQWKTENNIPSISWPAQSPDINVIENTWKAVKRHVQQNISSIETRQDLIACVLKRWREMPSTYIRQLYDSIPRRIRSVIISRGYITKY